MLACIAPPGGRCALLLLRHDAAVGVDVDAIAASVAAHRDVIVGLQGDAGHDGQAPYLTVFTIEILFLVLALLAIAPLLGRRKKRTTPDMRVPGPDKTTANQHPLEVS